MSTRRFTQEQIQGMLQNVYVHRCSEKSVTYTKDFKLLAVRRYNEEGITSKEIFRDAGFDLEVIGRNRPKSLLGDWNKIYKIKNHEGFEEKRGKNGRGGGRPKTKEVTEADKIKRLEAEVAYLKAENDFLAKLRAKRAESNSGRSKNASS